MVGLDERIGKSHMRVPNYDSYAKKESKGYSGVCLPKDANSLYSLVIQNNLDSIIIESTLYRNEYHDRRERDWLHINGRALISTEKNIVLVCGNESRNICQDLLQDINTIVISLEEELDSNHPNYFYKKMPLTKKLFFPKISKIYYHISKDIPSDYQALKDLSISMMNLIELAELHQCLFDFEGNDYSRVLYDAYCNK
jgi:hypothetical protein